MDPVEFTACIQYIMEFLFFSSAVRWSKYFPNGAEENQSLSIKSVGFS